MITINDVKNNGELFDDFIKENQKLVSMVIRNKFSYVNNTVDYDDYFKNGCIGLVKAARKYDPDYGTAFSTYAVPLIEGEIMRYRRDFCVTSVHTPRSIKDKYFRYQALKSQGLKDTQACDALKIDTAELNRVINSVEGICSLDAVVFDNNSGTALTAGDIIPYRFNLEETVLNRVELEEKMLSLKRALCETDFKILMMRLRNKSQIDIGKKVGLSQVQISRRLVKIKAICKRIDYCYDSVADEYMAG